MRQSDPQEVIHAVMNTYPGDRNMSYADLLTAKWLNDDVIRVIVHERKDVLDSWFNAVLIPTKVCRHLNWKTCCNSCLKTLGGQLEAFDTAQVSHKRRRGYDDV